MGSNIVKEPRKVNGTWLEVERPRDLPAVPMAAPIPEPAAPEPEPETGPVALQPAPYEHRPHLSPAAEADDEALALLAGIRGRAALDESLAMVAALDEALQALRPRLSPGNDLAAILAGIAAAMARRGVYAARRRRLATILRIDIDPIPDLAPVPRLATIAASIPPGRDLGIELADRAARLRSELASTEAELGQFGDLAAADAHYHEMGRELVFTGEALRSFLGSSGPRVWIRKAHPSDAWLSEASELVARRRKLREDLDSVEADRSELVRLGASGMSAAVAAAGGSEAVVAALVTAQALASPVPPPPAELEPVDAELARLAEAGIDGEPVQSLRGRRQAILDDFAATRQARRERRRQQAGALVSAAIAGDEGARASIESILAKSPDVAPGLIEAVAAARPDRALFEALAQAV